MVAHSIERSRPRRWIRVLGLVMLTALMGCDSDSPSSPTDVDADSPSDVAVDSAVDSEPDATGDTDARLCTPGTRRCATQHAAEVCDQDSTWVVEQCGDEQLCWGGTCGDLGTCEPYAVDSCVGYTRYQGCNPVGTGTGEFAVPFNQTCIEDEDGNASLVARLCLQGETTCDGDQILLMCAESGLEYTFSTNCYEDDATTLCDEDEGCIPLCQYIEKRNTYIGCEYWAVDLDNAYELGGDGIPNDAFNAQFAVAISNPGETVAAEVTIESIGAVLATGTVEPGDMQVYRLPAAQIDGTMHGYEAYRITSSVPVVAYQFNPLENEEVFSNDASLLFPTSSLGTDYWVMTRWQMADHLKSTVTIVATRQGDTDVTVRLPEWTLENQLVTLEGTDIPALRGGDELEFTLQQFEVLNIESNKIGSDLTGTYIEATQTVAVFGGNEATTAPNTDACVYRERQDDWVCVWDRDVNCQLDDGTPTIELCRAFWTCCADHLEQQMLPVFAWGRTFNAARSYQRLNESDVWRIMAGADDTEITLVGIADAPGEPTRTSWTGSNALAEGEWIEFESWSDFEIHANNPIFVGQFLVGLHNPGPGAPPPNDPMNGDPTFIMAAPQEQYRSDYIFLVPAEYAHNFVTIVVPTGLSVVHTDEVSTETLDAELFEPFASGDYSVLRMELMHEGYQRLVAEEPFGVTVYGYDDDVSYGYPAGLDLKEINR